MEHGERDKTDAVLSLNNSYFNSTRPQAQARALKPLEPPLCRLLALLQYVFLLTIQYVVE